MNPLMFLFQLILKYVPVDQTEFAKIKNDATMWYASIDPDKKETAGYERFLKKYGEDWRFKLGLAVLYIPVSNWLRDMVNPMSAISDDEDEL